jgi:hypothetical protein
MNRELTLKKELIAVAGVLLLNRLIMHYMRACHIDSFFKFAASLFSLEQQSGGRKRKSIINERKKKRTDNVTS